MKIIRVIYGTSDGIWDDIPSTPIFENEIVFVWGLVNQKRIELYGYKSLLVHEFASEERYSHHLTHFTHKLRAIDLADKLYDEYLFLDWDVYPIKKIDNKFFELIRNRGDLQIPIYSYHPEFKRELIEFSKVKQKEGGKKWDSLIQSVNLILDTQVNELEKYHWSLPNIHLSESNLYYKILPNFSFYYSNGVKLGNRLTKISEEYNIKVCIEEYSMFVMFKDLRLLDFIKKYEPVVINGQTEHSFLKKSNECVQFTNKWVSNFVEKDIYLVHNVDRDRLHLYSSLPELEFINEN